MLICSNLHVNIASISKQISVNRSVYTGLQKLLQLGTIYSLINKKRKVIVAIEVYICRIIHYPM